jgi:hypothetical protein
MQVSGSGNQLLSRIDSSLKNPQNVAASGPQGVTKADLTTLDADQDGAISQNEAPELNGQELSLVNQYLQNDSPANSVVFVRQSAPDNTVSAPPPTAQVPPDSGQRYQASAPVNAVNFPEVAAAPVPQDAIQGQTQGVAKGTGYYPANSKMEGGFVDKVGKPLRTLQDYLDGKADYVSIALDKNLYKSGKIKYGDTFRIPELEAKYGRKIVFKAVDTGGAFTNKGFGRVDICTRSAKHSVEPTVNGKLTLIKTP